MTADPLPGTTRGGLLRRPGGRWRLLVHEWAGREPGHREGHYSISHDIRPTHPRRPDGIWNRGHHLPNTEFDELVVGRWLHIEQLGVHLWWMNIGGVTVHINADRDGRPTSVHVTGPGLDQEPHPNCTYHCEWSTP